jgi:hypothetical protein
LANLVDDDGRLPARKEKEVDVLEVVGHLTPVVKEHAAHDAPEQVGVLRAVF